MRLKEMFQRYGCILTVWVIVGASTGLSFFWLRQVRSVPTIVTVDLKALVRDQISHTLLKTLSEEEIEQKVTSLVHEQRKRVKDLMRLKNVIVLSKEAVLTPVPDVTDDIREAGKSFGKLQKEATPREKREHP